jgi:hypothetical protein
MSDIRKADQPESAPSVADWQARLRVALFEALDPDAIREVVAALVDKAKKGDIQAARLLLTYAVGSPTVSVKNAVIMANGPPRSPIPATRTQSLPGPPAGDDGGDDPMRSEVERIFAGRQARLAAVPESKDRDEDPTRKPTDPSPDEIKATAEFIKDKTLGLSRSGHSPSKPHLGAGRSSALTDAERERIERIRVDNPDWTAARVADEFYKQTNRTITSAIVEGCRPVGAKHRSSTAAGE